VFAVITVMAMGGAVAFQQAFLQDLPKLPDRQGLWAAGRVPGVTFLGPEGQVIARRGPRHGERLKLAELPPHVAWAFLAVEDKRFYQHGPVDLRGLARAAVANARAGHTVEGGSTLTQQLARTLFLNRDQTLKRKIQEAILAWRLEQVLSKDEILELYLNRVYFGDRAYGLAAAADTYFGKPASQLNLSEAALLAGLPKAPSQLAPTNDMPAAWARGRLVLATLGQIGWITPAQAKLAAAQPPALSTAQAAVEGDMAWVLDAAAREAVTLVGDRSPDLVIKVTVDPARQSQATRIVAQAIASQGGGAHQGALVALAPDGAIGALVGGVDHDQSPFNRAYQARRQPGSAFKPFVWATALEQGANPFDIRQDGPIKIGGWRPQNYGGGYRGPVTLATALKLSLNTVSVRLTQEAGPAHVAALARRFGLGAIPERPGPSIALGAYEVSLLELTGAYQVLQNGGTRQTPYLISQITNARGDVLYAHRAAPVPVFDPRQAAQMVQMMEGVITSGTGVRAAMGRIAAGKTGTSQDYRDAWFVGFTPDWAAGVWVGNDDNRPMRGMTGGKLPAEIWRRFMLAAHEGLPLSQFDWMPPMPQAPPRWRAEPVGYQDEAPEPAWSDEQEGAVRPVTLDRAEAPQAEEAAGEVRIWAPPQPWREPRGEPAPAPRDRYVPAYGFTTDPGAN
jgi:penicillin-binding protein 1A